MKKIASKIRETTLKVIDMPNNPNLFVRIDTGYGKNKVKIITTLIYYPPKSKC